MGVVLFSLSALDRVSPVHGDRLIRGHIVGCAALHAMSVFLAFPQWLELGAVSFCIRMAILWVPPFAAAMGVSDRFALATFGVIGRFMPKRYRSSG